MVGSKWEYMNRRKLFSSYIKKNKSCIKFSVNGFGSDIFLQLLQYRV